jgi:S-DNA-T family DNA segregation ATPase FtsK/SpoIIIE
MFWVALFAAVSFILRDLIGLDGSTGVFGNWVADFLCGLFGAAAYLLPLFLVVIALRWKRFVREGILAKKLLLSASFLILLSGIIHVFQESRSTRGFLDTNGILLYQNGVIRTGGGAFGGFVGEWLGYVLRLPGTVLLAIPLLIIIGIYLVGLTPGGLWQRISLKCKQVSQRREQREATKYDGKEDRRLRANTRKDAVGQQKQEKLSASKDEEKSEQERSHYTFRDEEDEPMPRRAAEPAHTEKKTKMPDPIELVDIPDDDADEEIDEATEILQGAGQASHSADQRIEDILKELSQEEEKAPTSKQEVEEKPLQGSYYAPFALPIRPEPKHGNAEAAASSTVSAHASSEPAYSYPLHGKTTIGPLGSIENVTAPVGRNEETLGESRAEESAYHAPVVSEPLQSEPAPTISFIDEEEPEVAAEPERFEQPVVFERERVSEEPRHEESFAAPQSAQPYRAAEAEQPTFALADEESETETDELEEALDIANRMRVAFDLADEKPAEEPAPVRQAVEEKTSRPAAFAASQPQSASREERHPAGEMHQAPRVIARVEPVREEPKPQAPTPPPAPREYRYPHMDLLNEDRSVKETDHSEEIQEKIQILRDTLSSFNVRVKEQVDCSRGPTITRYELRPEAGVSVRSVINRIDDISLNLAAPVRIEAPIPGKPAIGIEVPNATRETVYMRTLLESETFRNSKKPLEVPLGLGVGGDIQMCNLAAMPHLLVAGTTGSGKSVCINTILIGLMYKTSPRDLRLILIDPKQIEFAAYAHVPHLYAPIVTESARAVGVLACAVQEMERRYSLIKDVGVRDIDSYNEAVKNDPEREHLPRMVIVIDEFADLKMSCPNNDPENFTCRLAQKARAAGMHLIIGTQRPSVDVITGKLKNNIPSRIAFTVMQQVDSRTILDMNGAESLTGKGDMLYMPVGCPKPSRVQGAFVSDGEVERVISYIRDRNDPVQYNQAFMDQIEAEMARAANAGKKGDDFDDMDDGDDGGEDPKFHEAVELAIETQKVATSLLQRRLGVGYGRAAKIIDRMEALGYVSAPEGNKARKVLITHQEYAARMMSGDEGDLDDGEY